MKYIFTILIFTICSLQSRAQTGCNFIVDAGEDTLVCGPGSFQLNGFTDLPATSLSSISWQPLQGLSDSTILNPVVTVNGNATYVLSVSTSSANLILNGDFSLGNTGFTSSYIPGTGGISGIIHNEGEYDINTIPKNSHIDFAIFGDHTTGTGNMMVVNGSYLLNDTLWSQTVNVTPNTTYNFSAWAATANWQNPAVLRYTINGVIMGPDLTLTSDTGVWENFNALWNSGSATSAVICIYDFTTFVTGNDFVIDDISLTGTCVLTDTINISIDPAPALTPGNDISFCEGDSVAIHGGSGYSTYEWQVNGTISGDTDSVLQVTGPGTYILTVTTPGGCTQTDTVLVTPGAASVNLPGDITACEGDTVQFAAPPGFASYQWFLNNTQFSNAQTISTTLPGVYLLQVTDSSGCQASDSIALINELLLLDAGNDISICDDDSVLLQLNGSPGLNLQYTFNGSTVNVPGNTIYISQPGEYIFSGTSTAGCAVSDTLSISQAPAPVLITIPDTIICAGNSVLLSTAGASTYQWVPSTYLNNPAGADPVSTPIQSITYTVTGTGINGCTATANISISVTDPPESAFAISSNLSCNGMQVHVENKSNEAVAFAWDFGDGTTSIENNPMHTYLDPGSYLLQLVAINGTCTDTSALVVNFTDAILQTTDANIFSPNGDGFNDCFDGGVNELLENCSEIEIFTRWGQSVFKSATGRTCWNGKNDSDGSEVPEGTYYYLLKYRTETIKGTVYVKR